jgi:hypothetical protein
MKYFVYNEPIYNESFDIIDNVLKKYSEEEILNEYWDYWENKMISKYGENHPLITKQNCIEDWIVTNWAWEVEEIIDNE